MILKLTLNMMNMIKMIKSLNGFGNGLNQQMMKKELNIYGSRNAMTKDFKELIDVVKSQGLKLDDVITNIYKFNDAAQAFADFDKNAGSMLKVMIEF